MFVVPFNVYPIFFWHFKSNKNSYNRYNPINLINFIASCFFLGLFSISLWTCSPSEEKLNPTNKMGIIRQMPAEILRMSPAEVDDSLVGTAPRRRPKRAKGGTR